MFQLYKKKLALSKKKENKMIKYIKFFIVNKFHLTILFDKLSKIRVLSRKLKINFYANLNIKVDLN